MTHQNLVLTEKAIKAHCKRLQKELKNYNQDLSLGETQNLFSKSLGFNNFHELKKVINDNEVKHPFNEIVESFYNVLEQQQYFKIFINPVKNIDNDSQKELLQLINTLNLGKEQQNIKILKIDLSEHYCVIWLDPNSKFSELNYKNDKGEKIYGSTISGVCDILIKSICNYLEKKGHERYYNVEYGYKIKNNTRIFIHLEDLILKRDSI